MSRIASSHILHGLAELDDEDAALLDDEATLDDDDAALLDDEAMLADELDADALDDDVELDDEDAALLDDEATLNDDDAKLLEDEATLDATHSKAPLIDPGSQVPDCAGPRGSVVGGTCILAESAVVHPISATTNEPRKSIRTSVVIFILKFPFRHLKIYSRPPSARVDWK